MPYCENERRDTGTEDSCDRTAYGTDRLSGSSSDQIHRHKRRNKAHKDRARSNGEYP